MIFFFEKFAGARGFFGNIIESILFGINAGGGDVGVDILIAVLLEGSFFGDEEIRIFGGVKN